MMSTGLFDLATQPAVLVARVLVGVDLPHLDHPLDYTIPEKFREKVQPGSLVKVRLAGRPFSGWVHEVATVDPGVRRLQPIEAVVSAVPVLSPQIWQLAAFLAERHISTRSQVLSLAIPPRHAGAESEFLTSLGQQASSVSAMTDESVQNTSQSNGHSIEYQACSWQRYTNGQAYIDALERGLKPRAVWSPLPENGTGLPLSELKDVIRTVRMRGESVLIVLPTQKQAKSVFSALDGCFADAEISLYYADLPAKDRYATHLRALNGMTDVVVGTRSTAWLPMRNLGLLIVWDDGDDRLREQRSPRLDTLDVLMARARIEHCALLVGSWARSVKAQALVESKWAHAIEAPWENRRSHTPQIYVEDSYDQQRAGASGFSQITPDAQRKIRRALESGPVLIQVPQTGFVTRIACKQCRALARCTTCSGQLSVTRDQEIQCRWCARSMAQWQCPTCDGTQLKALRIGSDFTGEHLGKAFPGIPLVTSTAAHNVSETLDAKPRLVIATPGREPQCAEGYELVVVVDAPAIAQRPELWAQEEALRRWMNAFALLGANGKGHVCGGVDSVLAQALIRWDPAYAATRLLEERRELNFFPAATIIALDGPANEVNTIMNLLNVDVMGVVPRAHGDGTEVEQVRCLIRSPQSTHIELLASLRTIQQERSAKKCPLVKMTVNPPELF